MRPLGDRRARLRYELVGTLRGTLELSEPARLMNISGSGALLETSRPIPVGSTQTVSVALDGSMVRANARICHLSEIGQQPERRYLIGVEFLSPPEALTASVAHLIAEAHGD